MRYQEKDQKMIKQEKIVTTGKRSFFRENVTAHIPQSCTIPGGQAVGPCSRPS
jgi:hypothetical protein